MPIIWNKKLKLERESSMKKRRNPIFYCTECCPEPSQINSNLDRVLNPKPLIRLPFSSPMSFHLQPWHHDAPRFKLSIFWMTCIQVLTPPSMNTIVTRSKPSGMDICVFRGSQHEMEIDMRRILRRCQLDFWRLSRDSESPIYPMSEWTFEWDFTPEVVLLVWWGSQCQGRFTVFFSETLNTVCLGTVCSGTP